MNPDSNMVKVVDYHSVAGEIHRLLLNVLSQRIYLEHYKCPNLPENNFLIPSDFLENP